MSYPPGYNPEEDMLKMAEDLAESTRKVAEEAVQMESTFDNGNPYSASTYKEMTPHQLITEIVEKAAKSTGLAFRARMALKRGHQSVTFYADQIHHNANQVLDYIRKLRSMAK